MANIQIMDTKAVIQFDCLGIPTHYRISELSDLSDASWIELTGDTVEYPLATIKTYSLFGQVKNSVMESNIKNVIVDRLDDYVTINLKVIIIDSGNTGTTSNTVNITLQYDGTPTQYKYALNPTLINGEVNWTDYSWNDYSSFPSSFYIGGNDGTKSLYFLLKDSRDATSELDNSIMFNNPVAPTLTNATYVSETTGNTVTITPTYSGFATQYSCETGTTNWQSFNGTSFDLTLTESGINNFTLLLKNIYGQSSSVNISITYSPPTFGLDSILINNGDEETSNTTLSIGFTKIGTDDIAYYRLGSSSDLSAVDWIAYTGSPVNYIISRPGASVGIVVYGQVKSANDIESEVKSDTIYFIVSDIITCKIMGNGSSGGNANLLFEGKYYCYSRISYSNQFKLYNWNSGAELSDWTIMNDAQTITEFGSAGGNPGGGNSTILNGTPFYNSHTLLYNDTEERAHLYWGAYVPNGTYKLSWLFSTANSDWGYINNNTRKWIINGVDMTLPSLPIQNNTTWVDSSDVVITDGKLKIEFQCYTSNKFNGFNGISIEKIA